MRKNFIKKSFNNSVKNLPVNNGRRVGLALNFAIFLYEIKGDKKTAFDIAKKSSLSYPFTFGQKHLSIKFWSSLHITLISFSI